MNIYLLGAQWATKNAIDLLKPYGTVIQLDSERKEIDTYTELFEDKDEKVIGVLASVIDFTFPLESLKKIPNLKGISTRSSWAEYLHLDYCKDQGIWVTNCSGANAQSVAEYAMWQMLSLAKRLPRQMNEQFIRTLDEDHFQTEIEGKTAGVIGLGNIGNRIAKMCSGLGMKVIYWSRSSRNDAFEYKEMDTVLKEADFVFNCVEICEETKTLLNKERLNLLRPEAFFISVLGGIGWGAEDGEYLIQMVAEGKLAGYSIENDHHKNVSISADVTGNVFLPTAYAWYTDEARIRQDTMWAEGIIGIITGQEKHRVA